MRYHLRYRHADIGEDSVDYENGPYLTAAFFCEKLLKESDGVFSAIRIIDVTNAEGPDVPGGTVEIPLKLTAFLAVRAGTRTGPHPFRIHMIMEPSSDGVLPGTTSDFDGEMMFGGTYSGVNTTVNFDLTINARIGDYRVLWFDVLIDGEVHTRMPLRVIYRLAENDNSVDETPVG